MRALLQNENVHKYFQRAVKKSDEVAEDNKLYETEEKQLAPLVGISAEEIEDFRWFFDQVKQMKLPDGWIREWVDQGQSVGYVNIKTGQKARVHPNLSLLKIFFYERLNNDRAAQTFEDKNTKLLPFIEEKLIKNTIGLNSKRKQAEKVNMKRDEKGKVVTSKTERIMPDTSRLVTSRNYLLKGIVEKVVTKHELWGYGKRAKQYSLILQKSKKQGQEAALNQDIEEEETLQLVDSIYSEACDYYTVEYGRLTEVPQRLDFQVYKFLTPNSVMNCLNKLGILKEEVEQYWLGLTMNCLYLPPLWKRVKGAQEKYLYEPKNMVFEAHPSLIYLVHQRSYFRQLYQTLTPEQKLKYLSYRQISFLDYFERSYSVDVYGYLEKHQEKPLAEKAQNNGNYDARQLRKINALKAEEEKAIRLQCDWMVIEGTTAARLKEEEYMLAEHVEGFWKSIKPEDQTWIPSVGPYGQVVWSHNMLGNSTSACPYQQEIQHYMEAFRKQIPPLLDSDYKQYQDNLAELDEFRQWVIQDNAQQRARFLEHFLLNNGTNVAYQANLQRYEDYFNQVFLCHFDLESCVTEELETRQPIPVWLEKVKANNLKNITRKIVKNTEDTGVCNQIYNIVKNLYLQSIKSSEPENLESITNALIAEIIDRESLLRFIDHAFDIGQREDRLRKGANQNDGLKLEQSPAVSPKKSQQSQLSPMSNPKTNSLIEEPGFNASDFQLRSNQNSVQISNDSNLTPAYSQGNNTIVEEPTKQLNSQTTNQKQLDRKLIKLKNSSIKVNKYTTNPINKNRIKLTDRIVSEVNKINNDNQRLRFKTNLISTNLRQAEPFLKKDHTQGAFLKKYSFAQTHQQEITHSLTTNMFNSTISGYDNQSMLDFLHKIPKKQLIKKTESDESFSPQEPVVGPSPRQPTEESVVQLVKIIKDSIKDDPLLRHIDDFVAQPHDEFGKTFINQTMETHDTSRSLIRLSFQSPQKKARSSSLQNSTNQTSSLKEGYNSNTDRLILPSNILQESGLNVSPIKHQRSVSISNFKRACLGNTTSHLLHTNAVITNAIDYERLQARKQLHLKSRGMKLFV